jgi:hypothetical protein
MSNELQPPSSRAAERLAVIVDAAERAALKVIDDAEKEAKRYLDEARARADGIVADRLREEADRLESGGGNLAEPRLSPVEHQLEIDDPLPTAEDPEDVEGPEVDDGPEVDEDSRPERAPIAAVPPSKPLASTGSGSAAARLLATQMAVSGSSRKEIEMRLQNGFEIEDTSEILDAILGPEE